jgi:hypothetical protein
LSQNISNISFFKNCIHVNPFNVANFSQYLLPIIVVFDLAQEKENGHQKEDI